MRPAFILFFLVTLAPALSAQCPYPVALSSTGNCLGQSVLTATAGNQPLQIVWKADGATLRITSATFNPTAVTIAGGSRGANNDQFNGLMGMYVDPNDNVYVADTYNNRVMKWAPGATSGVVVAGGNGNGSAANQLYGPEDVFVDGAGNVYVSDWANDRIQRWAPGAAAGVTVAGGNGKGAGANQLYGPAGIFVDAGGNVYVADFTNSRIQKWAPGATAGVTVAGGIGQLFGPTGIFVDGSGNMYITDIYTNRVVKWAPGATSGVTVAGGNGQGSAANQLNAPYYCYVDAGGTIYIADRLNHRIQQWAPGATEGITIAGDGTQGSGPTQLFGPYGIYVDGNGDLFVADGGNHRVQKYTRIPTIVNTYTPPQAGTYTAVITDKAGCTVTSNAIDIFPVVTPAITISTPSATACSGAAIDFTATLTAGGSVPALQWQINGQAAGSNSPLFSSNTFSDGDVVSCLLTNNDACATPKTVVSNAIPVTIHLSSPQALTISASVSEICFGDPVVFTAQLTGAGTTPVYQWQVNGQDEGDNHPTYTSRRLNDGDRITCSVTRNEGCATAGSNILMETVHPLPTIRLPPEISIAAGESIRLDPVTSGDITAYSWSPAAGLSDNTIADPLATPARSTLYTLHVTTSEGCSASSSTKVAVFSGVKVPGAFSPNGDCRNDVFYVLIGPEGSVIKEFLVFDRWGQNIFQVHNAPPGDPSFGWDGRYEGHVLDPGTYVYAITVQLADGARQVYRGTVALVR